MEKMLKMQEESDKKFMKLEERMLDMEEKRHKDNTEMFTVAVIEKFPFHLRSTPFVVPFAFHSVCMIETSV